MTRDVCISRVGCSRGGHASCRWTSAVPLCGSIRRLLRSSNVVKVLRIAAVLASGRPEVPGEEQRGLKPGATDCCEKRSTGGVVRFPARK
jgi:hypothetical protein